MSSNVLAPPGFSASRATLTLITASRGSWSTGGTARALLSPMASAREICNQRVVIAKAGESLGDVAKLMLDEGVGCVIVVEVDTLGRFEPRGILTNRDVLTGMLGCAGRALSSLAVSDVMQKDLVTACGTEPMEAVFERMAKHGVRRIPIVDEDGILEGVVSLDEWVEYLDSQRHSLSSLLDREREREGEGHARRRHSSARAAPKRSGTGLAPRRLARAGVGACPARVRGVRTGALRRASAPTARDRELRARNLRGHFAK